MKNRTIWLLASCLTALSLVAASCGTATTEETAAEKKKAVVFPTYEEPLSLGEAALSADRIVTITDAVITDSYQYDSGTKEASPDKTFLIVGAEIKNTSGQYQREGGFRMRVIDSEGNTYSIKSYFGQDRLQVNYTLPAGDELKGKVAFEIPKGATGLKIRYLSAPFYPYETLAIWEVK